MGKNLLNHEPQPSAHTPQRILINCHLVMKDLTILFAVALAGGELEIPDGIQVQGQRAAFVHRV